MIQILNVWQKWYRGSIFTLFPKDRNCEVRKRTKMTRAPCRERTGDAVLRAENFGNLTTADQKVFCGGCESQNNHRYAVVVQDWPTQWIQSYPCKTQTSQETERSLRKFLAPSEKPKVIYPPPVGTRNPQVFGSLEPTHEEPLRRGGAQGGSGSSPPSWIPNCGVQGEPVQMILRSTCIRAGRRAGCCGMTIKANNKSVKNRILINSVTCEIVFQPLHPDTCAPLHESVDCSQTVFWRWLKLRKSLRSPCSLLLGCVSTHLPWRTTSALRCGGLCWTRSGSKEHTRRTAWWLNATGTVRGDFRQQEVHITCTSVMTYYWAGFALICHEGRWPRCVVGAFVTGSTQHVCEWEEWAAVYRDDDTELKPTTENSNNYETYLRPDGNIVTVKFSIALKYCSSQVSLARNQRRVRHWHPQEFVRQCRLATCPNGLLSTWRRNWRTLCTMTIHQGGDEANCVGEKSIVGAGVPSPWGSAVAVHRQGREHPWQRQIPMVQTVQKIVQLQFIDKVVDVPVVQVVEETVEIPQLQLVEKIVVIPEVLTVQGALVRQVAQTEIVEVWRSERLFPENPRNPSSSWHLSWKLLQLLWSMYNTLPCGVRGARTRGHVCTCSGRSHLEYVAPAPTVAHAAPLTTMTSSIQNQRRQLWLFWRPRLPKTHGWTADDGSVESFCSAVIRVSLVTCLWMPIFLRFFFLKAESHYTVNSLVFDTPCEELSWNHCTSTLHRSETHSIAEGAVRRIKEGTSAVLLQHGVDWFYGMLLPSAKCSRPPLRS